MVCALRAMIIFVTISTAYAGHGPCGRKLFSSDNVMKNSEEFSLYLGELVNEQILTLHDLEFFIQGLRQNKILNPIQSPSGNKALELHHREFESILQHNTLNLAEIKSRTEILYGKKQIENSQIKKTEKVTEDVPFVTKNGAIFFKIKHPKLGYAYKILKPGGKTQNKEDWDPLIWPIDVMREQNGSPTLVVLDLLSANSGMGTVPKNSAIRKICADLGESIDLPTVAQYYELFKYFDNSTFSERDISAVVMLDSGFKEFQSLFSTHDQPEYIWSATQFQGRREQSVFSLRSVQYDFYRLSFGAHSGVRCIEVMK